MKRTDIYLVVDALASEYSWTIEYILSIPADVLLSLHKKMRERKRIEQAVNVKLIGIATACAFNGKLDKLDNILDKSVQQEEKKEVSPNIQKEQMRAMWVGMGRDPKVFEEQYKNGDVRF